MRSAHDADTSFFTQPGPDAESLRQQPVALRQGILNGSGQTRGSWGSTDQLGGEGACHALRLADTICENQYRAKIFHVFQRLQARSEYSGTGIGLSIVERIVKNHNGFITAESEKGKGAVFTVYLKL